MKTCDLTATEAGILSLLEQHRGQVLDAATIYEAVWGQRFLATSRNTVSVHILNLRQKRPELRLRTVWGRGYTLD